MVLLRGRKRLSLWVVGVGIGLIALIVFPISLPVVRISSETCAEIRPGMTVEEAEKIIGGRPGWYDGVRGVQTNNAPSGKSWQVQSWISSQGEIAVELDESYHVTRAGYYPVRVLSQHKTDMVWERLTRGIFRDLSRQHREIAYGIGAAVLVAALGVAAAVIARRVRHVRAVGLLPVAGILISVIVLVWGVEDVSWMLLAVGSTGITLSGTGALFFLIRRRTQSRSVLPA